MTTWQAFRLHRSLAGIHGCLSSSSHGPRPSYSAQLRPLGGSRLPGGSKNVLNPSSRSSRLNALRAHAKGFGKRKDGKAAEDSLKSTIEIDRFIDKLRFAGDNELPLLVAENVLAFDRTFWLRLATRADTAVSQDDRDAMSDLAGTLMSMVEKVVKKTQADMDRSSDALASLLVQVQLPPASEGSSSSAGELQWPPRDSSVIARLEEAVRQMDNSGDIDERFLASISAQLRQAQERSDRPGLVAMLQEVLQLICAIRFSRQSYSKKADGSIDESERLLEVLLRAPEEQWDSLLQSELRLGGGSVDERELQQAVVKRSERLFLRTESGSYEQRIMGEYLKEIEARIGQVVAAFSSSAAS